MEIANVTFSVADMVNRGIHLGHPRSQWNPKMAPYIYTNQNDVCIINLYRTIKQLQLLSEKLSLYSSQDKTFLFVGTKRQASEVLDSLATSKFESRRVHNNNTPPKARPRSEQSSALFIPELQMMQKQSFGKGNHTTDSTLNRESKVQAGIEPSPKRESKIESSAAMRNEASHEEIQIEFLSEIESSLFYVNQRWLGGMLTNWQTIKKSLETLEKLEIEESQEAFLKLPKKEAFLLKKRRDRLQKYLGGLKGMKNLPDVVIVLGQREEMNAVLECQKLGITTISVLDTDCDPTLTDLFVVANDDSKKSLEFLYTVFLKSIFLGKQKKNKD